LTVHGRPSALKLLLFAFVYYISGWHAAGFLKLKTDSPTSTFRPHLKECLLPAFVNSPMASEWVYFLGSVWCKHSYFHTR
jgi:hypothetical protein